MLPKRRLRAGFLSLSVLVGLLASSAWAGTNDGFSASIAGYTDYRDAEIEDVIQLGIRIEDAVEAKGCLISYQYDPAVVEAPSPLLAPGTLIPLPLMTLPGTPVVGDDGLATLVVGGTKLGGSPGSGSGLLGTMNFAVIGEIPDGGSFISVVSVQINASAADTDLLEFGPGEFGIALTRTVIHSVTGSVVDSDEREPVGAATVLATSTAGGATAGDIFMATTDEAGGFTMDLPRDPYLFVLLPPDDRDDLKVTRTFAPTRVISDTTLTLVINALLPNVILDLRTVRRHNGAMITWSTPFAGVDDVVRYRLAGADEWQTATGRLRGLATAAVLADLETLRDAGVDIRKALGSAIAEALGREVTVADVTTLRGLAEAIVSRRHLVSLTGLESATDYEFEVRSVSFSGKSGPRFVGFFTTRGEPDTRPVIISNLNVQPTDESAVIAWKTNRPADTRILVEELDAAAAVVDTVLIDTMDEDGSESHLVTVFDLTQGKKYRATVGSRLVDADALLAEGLLTEEDVEAQQFRVFRTRRPQPLRFIGPPRRLIGSDQVTLQISLNQGAWLEVDYGLRSNVAGKITRATTASTTDLFTDNMASTAALDFHEIVLSDLEPGQEYRFRVTAYLDGAPPWTAGTPLNTAERITTDPRGNRRWSKDLWFKTSLPDNRPPVITKGPQVFFRGRYAVVRWKTDVPTTGSVFLGTWGTEFVTLGTADEWETQDLRRNGKPRVSQRHRVKLLALDLATKYGFRVESTAANGQTVVFDPLGSVQAAGKVAKLAQPPGGAGRFTTDTTPDTQWPVILSGPTVSSKTHDAAVIEWITDEPADSEMRFGTESLDEDFTSADSEMQHKLIVTNLTPGTTYSYVIGSTDAAGNGATESMEAAFSTDPEIDLTPPQIIDGPAVVYKNDASATIAWVTDEDATAEADFGTTSTLGIIRSSTETGTEHEISLTNLDANTRYFVKVSSSDLSSNGPTESETIFFTTDPEADLTPPVISAVSATPTDTLAIITWTTDELANSYVEFGTDSLSLTYNVGDVELVTSHEIVLTNLQSATQYFFKVGSVDRANNAAESAIDSFTTAAEADTTPPSVPANLTAAAASQQILLTWDALLELDLNGFNVYRRDSGEAEFTMRASGVRDNEYVDLNVTNDSTYAYQITAVDRQNPPNESAASAAVEATPTANAAPEPPGDLERTGDNHLRPIFAFTNVDPIVTGETVTYTIQVSTLDDFSNVTASVVALAEGAGGAADGQTQWEITRDLEEGETYYWRVRGVEGDLLGTYSDAEPFVARDETALPGDFDGDGSVGFQDFFLFVDAFGQEATGDVAIFDLDEGGTVDFADFFMFVDNFGKTASKLWATVSELDLDAVITVEAVGGTRVEDQGSVTVRIRADGIRDMKAFGLVMEYDPRAVVWEGASPGPGHLLTSQGDQAPLFQVLHERPGLLVIGNGITDGHSVSGFGLLAELKFRVVGAASSASFSVTDALLASSGDDVRRIAQVQSTTLRPQAFYLGANFPNPFNPATSIEYGLPSAGPVDLAVFDLLGQKVRTLISAEEQGAGFYTVRWDGLDSAGRAVGSGLYFYRLETPQFNRTEKMTLLK
jgi:purple acid phosphatase-like protein